MLNFNAYVQRKIRYDKLERFNKSDFNKNFSSSTLNIRMKGDLDNNESIKATTMTFNTSLMVHCKISPYVDCTCGIRMIKRNDEANLGTKQPRVAFFRQNTWNVFSKRTFSFFFCEYNNCLAETEVTNLTDVVAIYSVMLLSRYKLAKLKSRWPHQMYVLMGWESPFLFHGFMEGN